MNDILIYALSFVGVPYIWGAKDGIEGFDCSGYVREVVKAGGVALPKDINSQGLYDYFSKNGSYGRLGPGSLAFYGENVTKITHVAICWDANFCLEAGGGDSTTTNRDAAVKKRAMVRRRMINDRKDLVAVIRPHYPFLL